MKYIYVLEDDPKLQKQIYDSLRKSDTQAQIRYFTSFEDFKNWIPLAMKLGKEAIAQGGTKFHEDPNPMMPFKEDDELSLLITKDEWLGSRYLKLVQKTHELFIRKGLCTKEDPTRLVLTAFESPTFDIKLVEERIISNVIFKPFDNLILQEHLNVALAGHRAATLSFVHKVQTEEEVEMTKEVQMEAVGDVGFVTRSPRGIKIGRVSKYYGEVFKSLGRIHIMGRCTACEPHPDFPGEFRVWFSYFGIPSRQISDIRQSMVKRNEIEYSGTSPFKSSQDQKKWIIVDPNKERALKFKKTLEDLFGASVDHFVGFDTFAYQCDPVGRDAARKDKPFGDLSSVTITFDSKGEKPVKIEPEEAANHKLFGLSWAEFKSKDFAQRLHPTSTPEWRETITHKQSYKRIFLFQTASVFFPIELRSLKKENDQYIVEFGEPSLTEKTQWFEQRFPNPSGAQGIMIAEEYLRPEKKEFWEGFKAKASKVKFFSLHEKTPNEKLTRQMEWVEDIFEESNDPFYVKRKLNWIFGIPLNTTEQTSPYLNSCKEIIRVANPVEIAELSEGGIVMNYYRAISPGSFRQFVLASTSETFIEYRAACNYSSEHPTEKDLFQNHFVFFGITDAYLKSIRLWILENHVQSKQQEGA